MAYAHPRRTGKSIATQAMLEEMLNAGKTVGVFQNGGMIIMRRKKHLTLMKFGPKPEFDGRQWRSLPR